MQRIFRFCLAGACLMASIASADVAVGSFPMSGSGGSLRTFADGASGDVAPLRTFGGSNTGLSTPTYAAFEPIARDLFVTDFVGQSIRVFDADFSGNVAPRRVITSPSLGQPRQLAINRPQNELYVIAFLSFINTYPLDANGAVAATRTIQREGAAGSQTRLTNPSGLVHFPQRDELYVGDYAGSGPFNGEILVFPRTASGLGAPVRDITGPLARLGNFITDLALDRGRGELYILVNDGSGLPNRIVVHDAAASGNVAPLREIAGPAALLNDAGGIAYDEANERIWVTTGGQGGTARLMSFARTASGNVAPLSQVSGSATGLDRPAGVHAFRAADLVFANGFE